MAADFELVYDEEELANKSDMRGKKRSARVEDIIEAYETALQQGAPAVKIPVSDDKERRNSHTFRYRLNAAAEALGIDAKASVNEDEGFALVTFDGKTRHKHLPRDVAKTVFELHVRLAEGKEQPMGEMIDASRYRGLDEEEMRRVREAGENAFWTSPGRPPELSRAALLKTTYQDYQRHRHGLGEWVSIKEREIGGVLDLLKRNESMTTGEALEALRAGSGNAGNVD